MRQMLSRCYDADCTNKHKVIGDASFCVPKKPSTLPEAAHKAAVSFTALADALKAGEKLDASGITVNFVRAMKITKDSISIVEMLPGTYWTSVNKAKQDAEMAEYWVEGEWIAPDMNAIQEKFPGLIRDQSISVAGTTGPVTYAFSITYPQGNTVEVEGEQTSSGFVLLNVRPLPWMTSQSVSGQNGISAGTHSIGGAMDIRSAADINGQVFAFMVDYENKTAHEGRTGVSFLAQHISDQRKKINEPSKFWAEGYWIASNVNTLINRMGRMMSKVESDFGSAGELVTYSFTATFDNITLGVRLRAEPWGLVIEELDWFGKASNYARGGIVQGAWNHNADGSISIGGGLSVTFDPKDITTTLLPKHPDWEDINPDLRRQAEKVQRKQDAERITASDKMTDYLRRLIDRDIDRRLLMGISTEADSTIEDLSDIRVKSTIDHRYRWSWPSDTV